MPEPLHGSAREHARGHQLHVGSTVRVPLESFPLLVTGDSSKPGKKVSELLGAWCIVVSKTNAQVGARTCVVFCRQKIKRT